MRLLLVPVVLALTFASPAAASPREATGGTTMPPATTGGLAVPGQPRVPPAGGVDALPAGGTRVGAPVERSVAGRSPEPPARRSGGDSGVRAAQTGPPAAPPTQAQPDDEDVDVQVPVEERSEDRGAARPDHSAAPFGGLARTGVAAAAFALLGIGAGAAGLGLRRMAR